MRVQGFDRLLVVAAVSVFISGWMTVFFDDVRWLFLRVSLRRRLRRASVRTSELSVPVRYAKNVLQSYFDDPPDERIALAGTFLWFFSTLFVLHRSLPLGSAITLSGILSGSPWLFLAARLAFIQKRGSREGLPLLSELYRLYWMNHKNMYAALEGLAESRGNFPVQRTLLSRMLLQLRSAGSPVEIREAVERYTFSAGTVWASMLGTCIRTSCERGHDVSEAILDLTDELGRAHARAEERSRINSETVRMTVVMLPVLYLGTLLVSTRYAGLGMRTFLRNQFGTSQGLMLFACASLLFAFNLIVLEFLKHQKIDC